MRPPYDYLKQLGCDYGQDYHMAKPMPKDEFVQRQNIPAQQSAAANN